jgi:hypothetical protein
MKTNLFFSIALLSAIWGCSNNPVNSSKEQPVQSLAAVATACTVTPIMQTWNSLTQTQKNAKILAVAQSMNGNNYSSIGLQCKQWVQSYVVLPASGITIGANTCDYGGNPNYYSWLSASCFNSQVVKLYSSSTGSLPIFFPGQIIQMWWTPKMANGSVGTPGPHTTIVVSDKISGSLDDSKDTMTWIDCNYAPKYTVSVHKISHAEFRTSATATTKYPQLGFSVYLIE